MREIHKSESISVSVIFSIEFCFSARIAATKWKIYLYLYKEFFKHKHIKGKNPFNFYFFLNFFINNKRKKNICLLICSLLILCDGCVWAREYK